MKRNFLSLLLCALTLVSLTACGGSGAVSSDSASSTAALAESNAYYDGDYDDAGWAEDSKEFSDDTDGSANDFSAVRQNAKLILTADLSLETQTFEETGAAIEAQTAAAGGYIESSSTYGSPGSRYISYTLRIPQEQFEPFLNQLGNTCHVVSSYRQSEDVTDQYTDIETRLATLQTKHERLLALLEQADKMEDIISLEDALSDCEYEIDSLTGSKRQYDDLTSFSTVSISLQEVQSLTAVSEGSSFGAQLSMAARSGVSGLVNAVCFLILTIVSFWPVLVIIAAAVIFILRWRKRKKQNRTPSNPDAQE